MRNDGQYVFIQEINILVFKMKTTAFKKCFPDVFWTNLQKSVKLT